METQTNKISISISTGFIPQVFTFMAGALVISGILAYWFAHNDALLNLLYPAEGGMSILGYVVLFAPLLFVLVMSGGFERFSAGTMMILFILFASCMGASLSSIFLIYSEGTLATTFFITAGTFGTMALLGYTTSTDLSKMGRILYMALIGLIIASVVNWFLGSSTMDYITSFIGVLIFTGLTAYDMQRLKRLQHEIPAGQAHTKFAIMGALTMYLNFVNLFLFLLRFFGSRD